jgi:MerR family transcriptional regulator, light-induced transcriptional regulator
LGIHCAALPRPGPFPFSVRFLLISLLDKELTECYTPGVNESLTYSMKVVARKAGLTPHAIRVWEKRYGAISPARTATNRRCYSDQDLTKLILLGKATRAGHSIGRIARLPTERLAAIVRAEEAGAPQAPARQTAPFSGSEAHLEEALAAIQSMDAASLQSVLTRASVNLSLPALLEQLFVPLMVRLGDLWREGKLRAAHEHMATGMVRNVLGDLLRGAEAGEAAPGIIVATPAGQVHEIGALMVAATAVSEGWRVTYVGPNLPAEEIAGAAEQTHARAVALSIVYPSDDPRLPAEIDKLRRYLPDEVTLLVGGRSAGNYISSLDAIRAVLVSDLPALRIQLERLRELDGMRGRA